MTSKADPPAPWYAPGLSFTCTQCGDCCTGAPGYVWFDEDEAEAMAARVGVSVETFYKRYATKKVRRWTLEEVINSEGKYDCVFLERDEQGRGKCSIYEVRPTQCRTWPFWDSNLKSPKAWERAADTCPGMRAGGQFFPVEQVRVIAASNPKGL